MKLLVIGGNGFLGSSLVEALRKAGHAVRVLDRTPARRDVDWAGTEYLLGGLEDAGTLESALEGIEGVFHLASSTVPGTSNRDPVFDVESNLVGALRLIEAMQRAGTRRIVYFSSGGTVYGNPDASPVREDHPLRPISSYGVVKVAIENYLMMYWRLGLLDPLVLRPSNPYGPRQSTSGVQGAIAAFLGRALSGEGVSIWGDGTIVRDYLYIEDLVAAAVAAMTSGECGVLNVGSGAGHSLNEVCELIRDVTGRDLPVQYLPGRDFDVSRIVLDIDAATSRLGWLPRVPLREGIVRTWSAFIHS
ncbi:NAD-dependent epimerase/dehydratase family protein [Lysobacter niastensis]|uniref:UDP-glucose 4-epimerase n=1 Tax=Lysobacter niastensis TaxID=380629 RepID=A0ABS0BG00_9GAMM|nr:NAD-dependent epimerase/dehydratase family protein [Lysobacter niastensis]MBF6025980.1 NAD-dependent epimerase/dehydratase family protein [Lysobacter niastensis]